MVLIVSRYLFNNQYISYICTMTTHTVAALILITLLVAGMLKIAFEAKEDNPEEWEQQERPYIEPKPQNDGKSKTTKAKPKSQNSNRQRKKNS
jgi:hypothetical protein